MSHLLLAVGLLVSVMGASCGSSPLAPESVADQPGSAPTMAQITPKSGPVGTEVTITGTGFAPRGNTVKFGDGYIKNLESADGAAVRFTVPDGLDLCAPDAQGPCPGAYPRVAPGDYVVTVITEGVTATPVTFTV